MQPLLLLLIALSAGAQTVTVTGTVAIVRTSPAAAQAKAKADHSGAVVSLEPLAGVPPAAKPGTFKILQKNKRFEPHVLAIPVGASVSFPNLDPFFHNVFSMFDGKRFDLGLYEAGATRSTVFTRPGVCFIFCNIHAEMSAVVVVMQTPYYAVTNASGSYTIANVPPGRYRLQVWHERAQAKTPPPAELAITSEGVVLPSIHLVDSGQLTVQHKNKYGHDYDHPATDRLYK